METRSPSELKAAPTTVRLTATAMDLWEHLAARKGLSRTAYLEMILRELGRASGKEADDYWIRLGKQGEASGYASPEETMRFIRERLDRDEPQGE